MVAHGCLQVGMRSHDGRAWRLTSHISCWRRTSKAKSLNPRWGTLVSQLGAQDKKGRPFIENARQAHFVWPWLGEAVQSGLGSWGQPCPLHSSQSVRSEFLSATHASMITTAMRQALLSCTLHSTTTSVHESDPQLNSWIP